MANFKKFKLNTYLKKIGQILCSFLSDIAEFLAQVCTSFQGQRLRTLPCSKQSAPNPRPLPRDWHECVLLGFVTAPPRLEEVHKLLKSIRPGLRRASSTASGRLVATTKRTSCTVKVVWYPKMDQKVCLNMVKKDQLCGIALKKRN